MFTQIPNMHLAIYMDTGLFGSKGGIFTVENKQVKQLKLIEALGSTMLLLLLSCSVLSDSL